MAHISDPIRLSPTVRASRSSDGLILLDVRGGCVLASNEVGARIWELLEEGCSSVDIAARIAADYGVPRERATMDVTAFIAALVARGVAEREVTR
jgi:Coenzyme PQQ synthesis protein D (PqqD)